MGRKKLSKNFNVTLDTIKNELHHLGYEIKVLKAHNEKQIDLCGLPDYHCQNKVMRGIPSYLIMFF